MTEPAMQLIRPHAPDQLDHPTGDVVAAVTDGLEVARARGTAAWDVLRGETVGPPVAHRRWPWALAAAAAGAVTGVVVVAGLSRLRTRDAAEAVEPEQVQAVIDRGDAAP